MIESYLSVFVNVKQDDWARCILMAKFTYNNTKNTSTGNISIKQNYGNLFYTSYKEDVNFYSQFISKKPRK